MLRKPSVLAAVLLLSGASSAVAQSAPAADRDAIVAVVQSAYVEGIHRDRNAAAVRAGFHPDFVMFVQGEQGLSKVTLDEWVARLEADVAKSPDRPKPAIRGDFALVDQSGPAAVVRVELHRDGKHLFTDYLSLYRFADGWKIVGKTFRRHG